MLAKTIEVLFPGIDFLSECVLQDDGGGPYIAAWNRPEPQPTQAEIDAATPLAQLASARAAIRPVSAKQIRIALNRAGLRATVEAAVSSGSQDLKDWWEFSVTLQRDHPLVVGMVAALGLPPEQVDALWAIAAGIE